MSESIKSSICSLTLLITILLTTTIVVDIDTSIHKSNKAFGQEPGTTIISPLPKESTIATLMTAQIHTINITENEGLETLSISNFSETIQGKDEILTSIKRLPILDTAEQTIVVNKFENSTQIGRGSNVTEPLIVELNSLNNMADVRPVDEQITVHIDFIVVDHVDHGHQFAVIERGH